MSVYTNIIIIGNEGMRKGEGRGLWRHVIITIDITDEINSLLIFIGEYIDSHPNTHLLASMF